MINVELTVHRLVADPADPFVASEDRLWINILNELIELAGLTSRKPFARHFGMGFAVQGHAPTNRLLILGIVASISFACFDRMSFAKTPISITLS
jgi:hypothetical protein